MAQFEKHFVQDLTQDIKIRQCGTIVFNGDNLSNVITVDLYNGTEPYSGGGSVSCSVICPDGATVPITNGSISGNTVTVTLTGDCFALPGQIGVGVQVVSGDIRTTILKAIYNVEILETDTIVDPGNRITASVGQLVSDIENAVAQIPASDMASLMAGIAPTFSASINYTAGAYVYYNGTLYRFTTAHSAGSWTGTDATQVALSNDLGSQVSDLKSAVTEDTDNLFWFTNAPGTTYSGYGYSSEIIDRSTIKINGTPTINDYLWIRGATTGTQTSLPAGTYIYNIELISGTGTINKLRYDNGSSQANMNEAISFDSAVGLGFPIRKNQVYSNAVFRITMNSGSVLKEYIEGGLTANDKVARSEIAEMMPVVNSIDQKFDDGLTLDDFDTMLKNAFRYEYTQETLTATSGYYIATDGTVAENGGSAYASISVEAGEHYKITSRHGSAMKMYVLKDSGGNVVEYYPTDTVSTLTETKEIGISVNGTLYINGYSNVLEAWIATGVTAEEEPFRNNWYLFGDSLSAPDNSLVKWCDYVADDLNLTLNNMAVRGRGYKKASSGGTGYYGAWINSKLPSDFTGILTIFGSGNDCQYMADSAGTSADVYDPSDATSPDTVAGRINYAFNVIKTKAPLAKVMIISPAPWQIYPLTTANNAMIQYCALLKECTEKAGFIYVDMYTNSGLRPWDDTQADFWQEQSPSNRVHPTATGHYFLYPQMREAIRKILPNVPMAE